MPTAPFTLAQLMTPQTLAEIKVKYLAFLQAQGFPAITEWAGEPTGTEMSFVEMLARALNQLAGSGAPTEQQIASVAAGNYLAWAKGGWLDLLAEQKYLLKRRDATRTTFDLTLASVPAAPSYQFEVGDIWLTGPGGKRYQSTTPGVLEPGGTVEVGFAAENVGSTYADDPSEVTLQLATPFAGVSIVPGVGDFSLVDLVGTSTGRLQPERTDPSVTPAPHAFAIKIDSGGEVGAATFSLSVDGGLFVPQGILQSTTALAEGTSALAIPGAAPSFVADDVFTFETPGTSGYVQGTDTESDAQLAQRCRHRWPAQSRNVTDGKVKLWALRAYPPLNRISVQPDRVTPGGFVLTGADSHGAISTKAIEAIEGYIRPRLGVLEHMNAVSAFNQVVAVAGSAIVPRTTSAAELEEIQTAATDAWHAYLASVDIGPSEVRLSMLVEILIDAGALDVAGLTLDGAAANVAVGAGAVPVDLVGLTASLSWGFA